MDLLFFKYLGLLVVDANLKKDETWDPLVRIVSKTLAYRFVCLGGIVVVLNLVLSSISNYKKKKF